MARYRVNLNGQQVDGPYRTRREAETALATYGVAPSTAWIEYRTTGSADEPGEWVRVRDSKAGR